MGPLAGFPNAIPPCVLDPRADSVDKARGIDEAFPSARHRVHDFARHLPIRSYYEAQHEH
ncbi:hypothetical protein ACNUDN_08595 [Mycobacterium sp. smrl_JER01]|uniref:hypothetical protein n=1 Tax=Mycobacterium sp. smrl_JER01 TaxID=3402633 RepID=UPI003ACDB28F